MKLTVMSLVGVMLAILIYFFVYLPINSHSENRRFQQEYQARNLASTQLTKQALLHDLISKVEMSQTSCGVFLLSPGNVSRGEFGPVGYLEKDVSTSPVFFHEEIFVVKTANEICVGLRRQSNDQDFERLQSCDFCTGACEELLIELKGRNYIKQWKTTK